jgi:hypothetical protein
MLVQLCASHIGSIDRLNALIRMLHSIAEQSVSAPVYLSISTNAELREQVIESLKTLSEIAKTSDLTICWRDRTMSQFEHYALLATELQLQAKSVWCILCDDDDYCHPNRVAWYTKETEAAEAEKNDVILCSNGILSANFQGATKANFKELDEHAIANPKAVGFGGNEHWMFAAKLQVLRTFCENIGPDVLANVGCDLVWRNFLRLSNCKIVSNDVWLYAKTMEGTFDHASLGKQYDADSISTLCTSLYHRMLCIGGISSFDAMNRMKTHRELFVSNSF